MKKAKSVRSVRPRVRARRRASPTFTEAVLNVLGFKEADGQWVALALEMDLRGYGATFDAALADLKDLVGMQISFARHKGQPEMMWKPAEPTFWELFGQLRKEMLRAMSRSTAERKRATSRAGIVHIDPAVIASSHRSGFTQAHA